MRKVILQEWMSLDGYVADRNGQLDFFTSFDRELNKYSDIDQLKFMDEIDTILLGRNTYKLFVDFWPDVTKDTEIIADVLNSTHKIVFSNTLDRAPWGQWPEAEIMRGEASASIRKLKSQKGRNMVLWGSITLAQSLIKENLVDEFHLQICPTVTGGGKALFPSDTYLHMKLIESRKYETGVMFLRYKL